MEHAVLIIVLLVFVTVGFAALGSMGNSFIIIQDAGTGFFSTAFTDTNLVLGVVTIDHTLGTNYPIVAVYDNNEMIILPDEITTITLDRITVDVNSFAPISGTWNVSVVGG